MKTLDEIFNNYKSETIDGRDLYRLAMFVPENDLEKIGFELKKGETHKHIEFNEKNVIKQLKRDVDFGFEKALDKRGLSSGMMYEVVSMWNWVLENELSDFSEYAQYGLPLFKATANLYSFTDEIDGFNGDECQFSAEADY